VGVSRDCRNFLSTPYYLRKGKGTNFKFGRCIQCVHANKSPLIIWEKRERGSIQGLSKFLEYPLLFQERVKLRTSNFVRTFLSIDRNKRALQISGKSSRGLVRTLEIFQGTHILSASRGLLYDSSAFLFHLCRHALNVYLRYSAVLSAVDRTPSHPAVRLPTQSAAQWTSIGRQTPVLLAVHRHRTPPERCRPMTSRRRHRDPRSSGQWRGTAARVHPVPRSYLVRQSSPPNTVRRQSPPSCHSNIGLVHGK